jgi:hypothetical protein
VDYLKLEIDVVCVRCVLLVDEISLGLKLTRLTARSEADEPSHGGLGD